jgi:transposase-like protein
MAAKMNLNTITKRVVDDEAAYLFLEELRWGDRPVCPHCASIAAHYFLTPKTADGRKTRTGKVTVRRLWKCRDCRRQFSVLTGTMMHGTKISIRTWVLVIFEMCASKNGVASREVERKYGLTPRSAWFLLQRIRECMKDDDPTALFSGVVMTDETWIGGAPKNRHRNVRRAERPDNAPNTDKTAVFSILHKETGQVRSRVVPNVRRDTLLAAITEQVDMANSVLHTDSAPMYTRIGWKFQDHQSVNHIMGEYVRSGVTTNHIEGFFSQLKRSVDGTFHAVSDVHLPRYLAEFDYRYSTRKASDGERMNQLMERTAGTRLTYDELTTPSWPARTRRRYLGPTD